jgi:hypothetical protein
VCSQIWLNHLIDDRHFSYIKKNKNGKTNPGPQMANKEKKNKMW